MFARGVLYSLQLFLKIDTYLVLIKGNNKVPA